MAKISKVTGINWIVYAFYNPCDPTPWIWLELAFPAAILAIWEYITPGWKDDIQYATGKSWLKHGKQNIAASEALEQTWHGKGLSFLFELAEELDKRAWQFMVFEVLYDAYMLWHSMLTDLGPCNTDVLVGTGNSKFPIDGRPLNYDWQVGPTYITEHGNIRPYIGGTLSVPPGFTAYWYQFDRFTNFITGDPLNVEKRITVAETGQVLYHFVPDDSAVKPGEAMPSRAHLSNPTGGALTMQLEVRLQEGQFPLVWLCSAGFCSVGIYKTGSRHQEIMIPTSIFKGVRNRHSVNPGKVYKRKKQSETDINDT